MIKRLGSEVVHLPLVQLWGNKVIMLITTIGQNGHYVSLRPRSWHIVQMESFQTDVADLAIFPSVPRTDPHTLVKKHHPHHQDPRMSVRRFIHDSFVAFSWRREYHDITQLRKFSHPRGGRNVQQRNPLCATNYHCILTSSHQLKYETTHPLDTTSLVSP